jgi:hypothetical protein
MATTAARRSRTSGALGESRGRLEDESSAWGSKADPESPAAILWIALAVALSPSLVELLHHWTAEPWSRGSAAFAVLGIGGGIADRRRARPRLGGWLLVGAGLLVVVAAFAAGYGRLGRVGIPLAALGAAHALGRPSLAVAALACFLVPTPFGVTAAFQPTPETAVAALATSVARGLGAAWTQGGASVHTAGGSLRLTGPDLGLPLAQMLAGLGWCAAVAARDALPRGLLRAARWACWAVPAQLAALMAGFACLALAGADAARGFLDVVPSCAVAAAGMRRLCGGGHR